MKIKINQKGFSAIDIILVIVALSAIGAAIYFAVHHKPAVTTTTTTKTITTTQTNPYTAAQLDAVAYKVYGVSCQGEGSGVAPITYGTQCKKASDAIMYMCTEAATSSTNPFADCPFTASFQQQLLSLLPSGAGLGFWNGLLGQAPQGAVQPSLSFSAVPSSTGGTVTGTMSSDLSGSTSTWTYVLTVVKDNNQPLVTGITFNGKSLTQCTLSGSAEVNGYFSC